MRLNYEIKNEIYYNDRRIPKALKDGYVVFDYPSDIEKQINIFLKSNLEGNLLYQLMYAKNLYLGKGIAKDESFAILNLGNLYYRGLGVEKNYDVAFEYNKLVTSLHNPIAMSN